MQLYPRILLAGLMGLPAADSLRHGDIWLCGSFVAGTAFVLAANRLFSAVEPEDVKRQRQSPRTRGARSFAIGHPRKIWFSPTMGS